MKMFLPIILAGAAMFPLIGCRPNTPSVTTPPAAIAPGYTDTNDQTLGKSLAALRAFTANEESVNFPALSSSDQAVERPYLTALIAAVNLADAAYSSYHTGTGGTLAQAQAAYANAQSAQTQLVASKGVK